MIHLFHGFLGSPKDFHFLQEFEVTLHDLYQIEPLPEINSQDILIGYSMGGRIALEIARKNNFHLKKIVLISAHPGLENEAQKEERKKFEETVLHYLNSKNRDEFLDWWNSLKLFHADSPISCDEERFRQSIELFERYRLSLQPYYLPEMIEHHEKILYITGRSDEKYMDLVSQVLLPHAIRVKVIKGGHRLFQHPLELKNILVEEGVL